MRRFEVLTTVGFYQAGRSYTFFKVPQVVKNAARVGFMREVPIPKPVGGLTTGVLTGRDPGVEKVAPSKPSRPRKGAPPAMTLESLDREDDSLGARVAKEIEQARGE